jgi:hypothetical protein
LLTGTPFQSKANGDEVFGGPFSQLYASTAKIRSFEFLVIIRRTKAVSGYSKKPPGVVGDREVEVSCVEAKNQMRLCDGIIRPATFCPLHVP